MGLQQRKTGRGWWCQRFSSFPTAQRPPSPQVIAVKSRPGAASPSARSPGRSGIMKSVWTPRHTEEQVALDRA